MLFPRASKTSLQRALLVAACALALVACGDDDAEAPAATTEGAETRESSALRRELDRSITRLLTSRGLDPEVTACALAGLDESLRAAELESAIAQIRKTGAAPPAVTAAAAAAGEACGQP